MTGPVKHSSRYPCHEAMEDDDVTLRRRLYEVTCPQCRMMFPESYRPCGRVLRGAERMAQSKRDRRAKP